MGWDAAACSEHPVRPGESGIVGRLDLRAIEAFREAARTLSDTYGVQSTCLQEGVLSHAHAGLLAKATGVPDYDSSSPLGELIWSPPTVMDALANANWQALKSDSTPDWTIAELRSFLEVCVAVGASVRFDW